MTFGEKLQRLRKERGLSQEQLSAQIQVSRQALSKWELGTAVPDTENVLQLSRLLGVSTDYLLRDELNSDGGPGQPSGQTPSRHWSTPRLVLGGCAFALSAAGLLVLGILSSVYPAVYLQENPEAGWVRVFSGLSGFLLTHRLVWLFLLCLAVVLAGLALLCAPWIKVYLSKRKARRKK